MLVYVHPLIVLVAFLCLCGAAIMLFFGSALFAGHQLSAAIGVG